MSYRAPIKDMLFVMQQLAGLDNVIRLPGYADATAATVQSVLEEAGKLCGEIWAPLNAVGDRQPAQWRDGRVSASPGFEQAFRHFVDGGWQGVAHPSEYGGQGLPKLVGAACIEMQCAANLSLATCPSLTDGAIEALLMAGSDAQKRRYLPRLVSGEWSGTMNLTEPQAGSDLGLLRTRAERQHDGSYRVFGTKIFISWGEHEMSRNIVHLVLARTPDAPAGVKGISLFLVPKYLVDEDGHAGERNDVNCVSIEHKMGLTGSPTAVLQYGDRGGAIGELIGEENRGLEYMFVMMVAARFAVGTQGIAIAERAYQKARSYAKERVQSRPVDGSAQQSVTIINHPDVRRMLGTMRALTEASRALAYVAAAHSDHAQRHPDAQARAMHHGLYEFMVPIVKGWSTEMSVDVASLGVQIHGGMGFIEETGAAQFYRDARILPIYEGTTAIQSNDLIGRKTVRDGGAVAKSLIGEIGEVVQALEASPAFADNAAFKAMHRHLAAGNQSFANAVAFMLEHAGKDPNAAYAGGVAYLKLAGIVLGGWQMARALLASQRLMREDPLFHGAKIATAHCYANYVLPQAAAFEAAIVGAQGGEGVLGLHEDAF
ncbi:acyl-CoA dehydrogenase [Paraburkholderia phymatum]|uniref:3-methylmercaptopropionyl-CoA dehydrogenase n=1 Tax=Paraburkholderia phymatum (strain DSM 17167 / CIP 108236 / LMG 21445 / STM815) TaxID=391038 RepID=B2JP60_PARP8|nr:acyl-CoA dehydrogenase [Paraburkholderia phymatum]ACC73063.1 acyl-CoA dehydrogenase domain protein [Paraburkholderia phymatum STM815]